MGRKIVGVDAGYVNFAVCAIDTDDPFRPYFWSNSPLFKGKFTEERLAFAIYEWIQKPEIKHLLEIADEIILERQMTMKFQAVNHCIRFLYFQKTREIHPGTVRAMFGLPISRKEKKKAAVELVSRFCVFPVKKGKKDDLADSFLLSLFPIADQTQLAKEPEKKRARIEIVVE
jgi:hypothetical protein